MQRVATALLLIPLFVMVVLFFPVYLLAVLQAAIALVGVWEFFRLAPGASRSLEWQCIGYAVALGVGLLSLSDSELVRIAGFATIPMLVVMSADLLPNSPFKRWETRPLLAALMGVVYVSVPMLLLVWIARQPGGRIWVLFCLAVVWAGDSAGYLVGRKFGKHKSSPRVSPNKTWEGTIASSLAALVIGIGFAALRKVEIGYPAALALAACLNVAGQFGDLAESAIKRNAGVKDSSQLIPGHGGVLDRIDALLFASPVLWYYWLLHLGWPPN